MAGERSQQHLGDPSLHLAQPRKDQFQQIGWKLKLHIGAGVRATNREVDRAQEQQNTDARGSWQEIEHWTLDIQIDVNRKGLRMFNVQYQDGS